MDKIRRVGMIVVCAILTICAAAFFFGMLAEAEPLAKLAKMWAEVSADAKMISLSIIFAGFIASR